MKNLTFKAAMLKGSQPTVNRRSTDGQSQRHCKQTPLSKRWKVLMTLVFLFTFAIGNVWAVDYSPLNYNGGSTLPSGYKYYGSSTGVENKSAFSTTTYQGHTVFDVTAGGTGAYNKRAIEFTVSEDCTLDIEFYVGNDGRILNLFHGNSTVVHSSTGTTKGDNKYTFSYSFEGITSDQTYSLSGSGSKVYISKITFAPAVDCTETAPTSVAVSGGATYDKGDALSNLSAAVTGGTGTMSYQWYRNTTNAATISNELKLANCTTATLAPSNKVGTYYYYCVASNCAGSVTSNTTAVTINADCSATGDIFTLTMNLENAPTSEVKTPASSTMNIDKYINIDGGDIILATGSSQHSSITTTPRIKLGGSSGYAQITLDCPWQEGDIITFEKTNKIALAADAGGTNKIQLASGTNEYTITKEDCLYNQSNLFVLRDGNNVEISSITITRPVYRTITLEYADGVTPDGSIEVIDGEAATKPADPTWAHHRFDGWYNGEDPYVWTANVTGNLTLTAHWTQLYTVTYAKGEESATGDAPTQAEKAEGETFKVAANTFAVAGKDFDKWNDGTNDYNPDDTYTVGTENVVLTAQWKTASAKYTVIFKDGDTELGTKLFEVGSVPSDADIEKTKPLYTFAAWQKDAADIALDAAFWATVAKDAEVTLIARYTPAYATSINIEQWVLDNGAGKGATTKTSALLAEMGTKNYLSNITWENKNNELDTLDDSKTDGKRNYAYLGLKVKKDASNVRLLLQDGKSLKVKFGNVAATPNIKIGDADATAMTITDGVYSLDAASGDREITISTTSAGAVVIKQIMINEDIAAVTLPWRVTYDANGGTCATAEAIWSGAALILPDATPASEDYTFAGWYDGDDLAGAAGANYNAEANVTLVAHYAPVEYAIAYDGNGATSGSMSAGAAGWGTMVTPDANAFEKTGHVFSGWEITKTSDGSATGITFSEGKFEMPKYDVTLVAQWEDNSKVAVIVETNVKYNDLAAAIEAAEPGQTVQLIQDINQEEAILIAKNLTLDLNNKTFTVTNPSSEYSNRAIKVTAGTIVIENGTVDALSNETHNSGCWGSLRQEGGHLTCNNVTFKNYRSGGLGLKPVGGTLILNECTVLSEFGGGLELGNATVEVNNCTFTQTGTDAQKIYGACFGMGKMGTLTINGGTYTSDNYAFYIYTSGGTINVNSGTFAGDIKTEMNNTQYPSAVGTINISGGTFDGVGENPIVFTAVTANDHISISGGVFDAPIENQYCAEGYVPQDNGDGSYGVKPKDGVCLIKGNVGDNTFVIDEDASLLNGTPSKNNVKSKSSTYQTLTGWKFNSRPAHLGLTLSEGTFQKGDVVEVFVTSVADDQGANDKMRVFTANDVTKMLVEGDADMVQGANRLTLPETTTNALYLVRGSENADYDMWNPYVAYFAVYRAMNPVLTAITINGRAGVIDPENDKHFTVTIPNDANLASLTVVPTIVRNAAHATTPEAVISNEGAWVLTADGDNTYRIMDKDGDYTDYTITLSRDVLKHAVKFYDGETLLETLEVEDGTQMAAGDVPADPTKEDYLFQGWAETADGAAVDVTSFTISAAKNFYAKWAADGAIKLINKTSGAVNEDGYFITGVTATEANSEKAAAWGGTQGATISGTNQLNKVVQYNATTNQTKLQIKVYNTNNSEKYVYIHKIIEGNTTEETVETLTATSKTVVTSEYYEFNNTKNRSFYITTNSADVKILQVKVIESGETPMKQAGEAGYSLNLNKGRALYYANSDVTFEGLALQSASNYSVISSSEFQTTKNISFSISSPVLLKVTTSSAKYYVSQNPDEDGTTATAITAAGTAEFELTETTNPWYLVPSTTSNVKYTNIAFELPKAEAPVIETQPQTKLTFDPGNNLTATVVAAEPTDGGTLKYQWYDENDEKVDGATVATLTTTTPGTYYVVVTNTLAGHQDVSVSSEEAELGYRVTNDATLMALSYGGTAITLEDGVYDYNVELAKGTTDVPALAATATMNGYATVTISNAAEFVNYEASSTVTVKSEDATVTNVYTVNFTVKHDLPQVDVTATTTWNWANAATTMQKIVPAAKNVEQLMANIDDEGKKLKNDAEFNSQALIFSGQEALVGNSTRWYAKGGHIKFNVTVPGIVKVEFSDNGTNDRRLKINNYVSTESSASETDVKTYAAYVQPGEVTLMGVKNDGTGTDQYIRISKITFTANPEADYTRNVSNNIGTLCVDHNVLAGGALGATFYQIASRNEQYNDKIDFEEVLPNEELKAGEPYIFKSTTGKIELFYGATAVTEPEAVRGMHGWFDVAAPIDETKYDMLDITEENKSDILYIAQNKLWNCEDLVTGDLKVVNNRAYIVMSKVPTYAEYQEAQQQQQNPAPRRRVTLGRNAEQVATGIEDVQGDKVQCTKMLINGQLFILRGEKMYDAKGQLVK